ncbi:TIGR00730 family Rossman fold protein [Galbibacter pacificus]|uniref:Cytokinin riboside 5'-monophosphate phosphoribohydrolase n=1 Tax=Galbibacter pacificus TaxID=2996052 RepID=A0ABT6FPH3_9FLAO|nr:TIGR00730 family Rossman fold protein [Galbibacter pacificus]MDG3582363.1 TIGR00730 family Rossman fold protein [Galbibacter pacificus]MDG3585161.1 TIGR00730 family Rossman fold protein [Galbibacter pacificus]
MKSVVIFCGSSEGNDAIYGEMAKELGSTLAKNKLVTVYGGSKLGLMGKVAQGALENNGKVIGVIPEFLKTREIVHTGISEIRTTQNMHERKLLMSELSDAVIALPGGFGTMEELFEIVTWGQLGLHQKPIGILNINGFYNDMIALFNGMVAKGFLKQENYDLLLIDETIDGLLTKMKNYQPVIVPKWIKKEQT